MTAIDINPQRLQLALDCGATHAYNSAEMSAEQIASALHEQRFDQLILETAGSPLTVILALNIAGPSAQLALVGTLHKDLTLPASSFGHILRKELTVLGSWMNYSAPWPGEEWQQAVQLFEQKKLRLEPLIASIGDATAFAESVNALAGQPMQGKLLLNMMEH